MVNASNFALIGGYPQASTSSTRMMYGIQAIVRSRLLWLTLLGGKCPKSNRSGGFPNFTMTKSDPIAAIEARMSVSSGPTRFEIANCVPANAIPQIAAAGRTARNPDQPQTTTIMYAGINKDTGAQILPTPALNCCNGRLVVALR